MCKSLTNYFPRNNDFLVTYFGKTQISLQRYFKQIIARKINYIPFYEEIFTICFCFRRVRICFRYLSRAVAYFSF